jgi:hypothetical protein
VASITVKRAMMMDARARHQLDEALLWRSFQ